MPKVNEMKNCLEDKVRLAISIIGIGNAGNQIIAKAHRSHYPVFAINSSLKDLSNEVVNADIPSFLIGTEARGAGKNRDVAKALFKENGRELFKENSFTTMVESSDVIFIVGSTAGGTGSGVAPLLCDMFKEIYPGKIIIYYGIIPKLSDSVFAQYNTLDCIDEIEKLKIPYMLDDLSYWEDVSNDIAYTQLADHVIQSIDVIAGKYLHYSDNGMIDENDMRVIIGESGHMAVYCLDKITHQQVDKESIQSQMIKLVKHSPAVDIIHDEIVKELGVIVNCPEEMAEATKTGNYKELTDFIGTPFAIFENYSTNNAAYGQFIIILSGMNLPYSRLSQCTEIVNASKEKLQRAKEIHLGEELSEFDFIKQQAAQNRIGLNIGKKSDPEKEESSKEDILAKWFN